MSKEILLKYADISQNNKKKCFALGNWCNKQGNIFSMQEVFDCLYDFADGNFSKLTELIEQLTSKSKVFGRSSVVFGNGNTNMYITRGEDGRLQVRGHNEKFLPNKKGQHSSHTPNAMRKDGQLKKNVINSREKLYDLGKEVREIYQGQSNEFITYALKAIKNYAKQHKISEMIVVNRIKKDVYVLDTTNGIDNAVIVPKMKTLKLNEGQLNELAEATKLTEYKFYNNVQRFLSDLLKDPVGAKVPFLLQANNIARNQLLYHLKSNGIINRYQKISDKDSQGNPKTARMIIKYSVPKKDFAKKMKKLFITMVAKNVPEKVSKLISENVGSIENNLTDSKYMVVYHSSGADFDEFDTKNHGYEGEGAMVHGFGTYFSATETTAQDYFKSSGHFRNNSDNDENPLTARQTANRKQMAQEVWSIEKKINDAYFSAIKGISAIPFNDDSLQSLIEDEYEYIFEDIVSTKDLYCVDGITIKKYMSKINSVIEELSHIILNLKENNMNVEYDFFKPLMSEENFSFKKDVINVTIDVQKKLIQYEKDLSDIGHLYSKSTETLEDYEMDDKEKNAHGIFYMAQIPKSDGVNYLVENEELNDTQLSMLAEGLKSKGFNVRYWENNGLTTVTNAEGKHQIITGKNFKYVYNRVLVPLFGNQKNASNFLNSIGFVGIQYYGGEDGLCYVVFNDKDINIMWQNKNEIEQNLDECDCGGAMGATAGNESMGQYSQPLFGVQRRKMPTEIDETTATTNTGNYQYTVPFAADKETADRTPGFSVERQDEDCMNEGIDEYLSNNVGKPLDNLLNGECSFRSEMEDGGRFFYWNGTYNSKQKEYLVNHFGAWFPDYMLKKDISFEDEDEEEDYYEYWDRLSDEANSYEYESDDEYNKDLYRNDKLTTLLKREYPEEIDGFGSYITNKLSMYGNYAKHFLPNWFYLKPIDSNNGYKLLKNEWMVHFTDNDSEIVQSKYFYGADLDTLSLTLGGDRGDYVFAFDASLLGQMVGNRWGNDAKDRPLWFGKNFIMFQGVGALISHSGDKFYQVIADRNTIKHMIQVKNINGEYCVLRNDNQQPIFKNEDYAIVIQWIMDNFIQYHKKIDNGNFQSKNDDIKGNNQLNEDISNDDFVSAATYIFANNKEGERCILAAKRRGNYSGGLYNVPVGMREEIDENIVDTAVREVQEETGLTIPSNLFNFINGERWGKDSVGANFVVHLNGTVDSFEIGEGDGENDKFSWIPLSQINSVNWAYNMGNTVTQMSKI